MTSQEVFPTGWGSEKGLPEFKSLNNRKSEETRGERKGEVFLSYARLLTIPSSFRNSLNSKRNQQAWGNNTLRGLGGTQVG